MSRARHLDVWLVGELVGRLTQGEDGRLGFAYDAGYVDRGGRALSSSLPTASRSFDHRATEPVFGGLLPEEGTRERLARALGISARNDFALLAEIGGECAGAGVPPRGTLRPTPRAASSSSTRRTSARPSAFRPS